MELSDDEFQKLINEAFATLPEEHTKRLENVAILYEEEPTPEQRERLKLRHDQSLYGLYEGVPLPFRQGTTRLYPDKITLFKQPLLWASHDVVSLKENIRHTLWHEIAHYYGLDHDKISKLEQ
ncbi:MAG: metallopeptidase family protein [Candidatus Saccharimonadales bacterium]